MLLFFLYLLIWLLYSVWSFTLVDPNIIFTSWSQYLYVQNLLWSIDKKIVGSIYLLLVLSAMVVWTMIVRRLSAHAQKNGSSTLPRIAVLFGLCLGIGVFSYNALSHDIFNYIFNARMVIRYGADPHLRTALEFASRDDWVRFMHNIHTPAPYWYGWTAVSLVPYVFGFGKFTLTWLLFKLWSVLGYAAFVAALWMLAQQLLRPHDRWWVWALALHPLFLIEFASNAHNDGWMMASALASFVMLYRVRSSQELWKRSAIILGSLVLLALSISMKYVTIVMVPLWLLCVADQLQLRLPKVVMPFWQKMLHYRWDMTAVLLLLPLLTARSQQFHPWYILWAFACIPFVRRSELRVLVVGLSLTSLFRYIPWLWAGAFEFTPSILSQQKLITWSAIPLIVLWVIYQRVRKIKNKRFNF